MPTFTRVFLPVGTHRWVPRMPVGEVCCLNCRSMLSKHQPPFRKRDAADGCLSRGVSRGRPHPATNPRAGPRARPSPCICDNSKGFLCCSSLWGGLTLHLGLVTAPRLPLPVSPVLRPPCPSPPPWLSVPNTLLTGLTSEPAPRTTGQTTLPTITCLPPFSFKAPGRPSPRVL